MTAAEKLEQLVVEVRERTERGGLPWRVTVDGVTFEAKLGRNLLFVTRYEPEQEEGRVVRYEFTITDGEYHVLDSVTRDLHSDAQADDVAALYAAARRAARNGSKLLDDLLLEVRAA